MPPLLNGRRAQAARNDNRILDAATKVFLADPEAPIATVAKAANVGISALYRRYASKQDLLRAVAFDGLARFKADLELALADDRDPWTAYCDCLTRVLEGGSQALAQRVAGTFVPTPELGELAAETGRLYKTLHQRVQRADALRDDVSTADVILLLEMLSHIDLAPQPPTLRKRYLALVLQSLRAGQTDPLPEPPAADTDLANRWRTQSDSLTEGVTKTV